MLNLHLVQKQRARLYKNELRRQFEQKQQLRKNHSMQLRSKDQQELQQKIQLTNTHLKSQRQRNYSITNQLKQQNMLLASLKNQNKQLKQSFVNEIPLKGTNIMDALYQHNDIREKQYKNVAKKLNQQYHQQENLQIQQKKQFKKQQINEDKKHLQTLKQLQDLRRKQYQEIKNKHSPQPKIGDLHKRLQQVNQQYKKSLESFAYNGRDILDTLKRDDSKQIYQRNKRVQSQLKYQMQQKKYKQEIQKQQYIGQQQNLQKSILGSILYKDKNYDKKQYANYLIKQMNQTDLRRSTQKVQNKQKVQIGSIYGGQGGSQRLKMIKYIDKNLGIESDYLKDIQSGNKSSSPYRMKNLYQFNGDNLPAGQMIMSSIIRQHSNDKMDKTHMNPQKLHTQQINRIQNRQINKIENRQRKTQSSSINQQNIRLMSSSQISGQHTPRSYLGYDLIKGSSMRYQY